MITRVSFITILRHTSEWHHSLSLEPGSSSWLPINWHLLDCLQWVHTDHLGISSWLWSPHVLFESLLGSLRSCNLSVWWCCRSALCRWKERWLASAAWCVGALLSSFRFAWRLGGARSFWWRADCSLEGSRDGGWGRCWRRRPRTRGGCQPHCTLDFASPSSSSDPEYCSAECWRIHCCWSLRGWRSP